MTTDYAERFETAMQTAYGPFQPGTVARAIRHDNARLGYRTCWHCLAAFRPHREVGSDGKLHKLGRGRWYCSNSCARADSRSRSRARPIGEFLDAGTLVLDLRRCRECS